MAKNVQLLTTDANPEVLHPETVADMVIVSSNQTLSQKIVEINAELNRKLNLSGGTLTGLLTANAGINTNTITSTGRVITNESFYATNGPDGAFVAKLGVNGVDLGDTTKSTAICSSETPKYWDGTTRHNIHNDKDNPININSIGDTLVKRNANGDVLAKKKLIDDGEIWKGNAKTVGIGIENYGGGSADGYLRKLINGNMDLGHSNYKWRNIYATNGTINTSDMRHKSDIRNIDDNIFFELIKNTGVHSYVLNYDGSFGNVTQETCQQEYLHVGIIAQEMAQYSGWNYVLNTYENKDGEKEYGVNNYNLTSAIMAALKVEIQKREELEEKVTKLEKLIANKVS